jgi:release factor glutamine methyltransferase
MRTVVADAAATLAEAGVDSPRVDAELLAAYLLGVPRARLALLADFDGDLGRYRQLVRERASRVPLQHLVGSAPFRHLELAVGPGVFIPRPETEPLVTWGLATLAGSARARPAPIVVDLCSGSGAIALAVAQECPAATVYAVERSRQALTWLRRNVSRAGGGVAVVEGDAGESAVLSDLDGRVDLVLCNPPYVPEGVPVPPEVGRFDPAEAVFAGPDGLSVVRRVVDRAAALLRPGGGLGIEHDDGQGAVIVDLLRGAGYRAVADHLDLAGRPRFATALRGPAPGLADCTS